MLKELWDFLGVSLRVTSDARAYKVMFNLTEREVRDRLEGSNISELGDTGMFDTCADYRHF